MNFNRAALRLSRTSQWLPRRACYALPRTLSVPSSSSRLLHTRRGLPYPLEKGLGKFLPPKALETVAVEYHDGLLAQLNEEVRGTEFEKLTLVETVTSTAGEREHSLAFSLSSLALNNAFFLSNLKPPPTKEELADIKEQTGKGVTHFNYQHEISYSLLSEIRKQHGSLAQLKSTFSAAAMGMFTSGYIWLVTDRAGNLAVLPTFGPGSLLVRNRRYALGDETTGGGINDVAGWRSMTATERNDAYSQEELREMLRAHPAEALEAFRDADLDLDVILQEVNASAELRDVVANNEIELYLASENPEITEAMKDEARAFLDRVSDAYAPSEEARQEMEEQTWAENDSVKESVLNIEQLASILPEGVQDVATALRDPKILAQLLEEHPEMEAMVEDIPALLELLDSAKEQNARATDPVPETDAEAGQPPVQRSPFGGPSARRSLHTTAQRLFLQDPVAPTQSPLIVGANTPSPYSATGSAGAFNLSRRPNNKAVYVGDTLYPLMALSVHEHAWMSAGYGVWGKEDWVKEYWRVVDWKKVSEAYEWFTKDKRNAVKM